MLQLRQPGRHQSALHPLPGGAGGAPGGPGGHPHGGHGRHLLGAEPRRGRRLHAAAHLHRARHVRRGGGRGARALHPARPRAQSAGEVRGVSQAL